MITFRASSFYGCARVLEGLVLGLGQINDPDEEMKGRSDKDAITALEHVREWCEEAGLDLSAMYAENLKKLIGQGNLTWRQFIERIPHLQGRIQDELRLCLLMQVPRRKAEFYQGQNLFGQAVTDKFPSATLDIEEAGKCYALARNTGCVFHLMRVMEVGVKALAAGLGILNQIKSAQPSWGEVLRLTNAEIQARNKAGDTTWTPTKRVFFENVQADLMVVKNAWRNTTMHVENAYDEERAEDIYNAVKGFMRHLANHVDESGNYTP